MIRAYVGLLGSGKTVSLVRDALRRFRLDIPQVYSDISSLRFPEAVYLSAEHPEMVAQVSNGLVLLDEAQIVMDSRFWQRVPAEVLSALSQLRKNSLDVFYTTQVFEMVESRLRGLTNEVVYCKRLAGRWCLQQWRVPGTKEVVRKRVYRMDDRIFRLYDTLEIVGRRVGEGVAMSAALAAVRAGSRSVKPKHGRKTGAAAYDRPVFCHYDRSVRLTREAKECRDWLFARGVTGPGWPDWADSVAGELRRRAWLADFGLLTDDVPVWCTYEDPWLAGWAPEEVRERLALERAVQDVEEFEQLQARKLRGRRLSGGSSTRIIEGKS